VVALTYDDGPDPVWTARVLAELERDGATATFFVDARRAAAHPDLIAAMGKAGHEVGFHCLEHRRHSERSEGEVAAETATGLGMLEAIGVRPTAWRPPWGVVTAPTHRVASEHGLELWGWNFDSHDWRGDSCERMLAALEAVGGLGAGSVVLMHDGIGPGALRGGCPETVMLTRALLTGARARGFQPVPVAELASKVAP
jgi:peptidoglycan/xylan/chitin deacetylase (PgdA/CDA1 family)